MSRTKEAEHPTPGCPASQSISRVAAHRPYRTTNDDARLELAGIVGHVDEGGVAVPVLEARRERVKVATFAAWPSIAWRVVFDCPHCGDQHVHGDPGPEERLMRRAAHCWRPGSPFEATAGYWLRISDREAPAR